MGAGRGDQTDRLRPADQIEMLNDLPDDMTIDIKKFREKRSLDANAYCWVLLGKLADAAGIPVFEMYRECIRDIGGNYEIVPIRNDAVDTWMKNWQEHGIGWISESMGESKLKGYTNTINYYGSSTYDTRQMARLIDRVIEECKTYNIETMTPQELEGLKSRWA